MNLSIIAAMTDGRVIGANNRLPWHLPEDLQNFKRLTMGHAVIMGRKTFESLQKPLIGRTNIVITANPRFKAPGAVLASSFDDALRKCKGVDTDPFVIGGATIFAQALPHAQNLYLTILHTEIQGDTHFPVFNLAKDFDVVEKTEHISSKAPNIAFSILHAKRKI